MAIGASEAVAETADTSNGTSYANSAFTPSANSLLVGVAFGAATVATATASGGSLTWTPRASVATGGGSTIYVFTAPTGSSPASTTFTFDCTGDAAAGAVLNVIQITGCDTSSPVVQTTTNSGSGADPVLTFGSNVLTTSAYVLAVGVNRTAPAYSPPSGSWTESCDTGFSTPNAGMMVCFRAGGETTNAFTLTGSAGQWAALGIEIAVAPTPGSKVSTMMMMGIG